jgi:hypothetical protein
MDLVMKIFDAWGRGEVHAGFWFGRHEGKRALGRPIHRWGIVLNWIFIKWEGGHGLA